MINYKYWMDNMQGGSANQATTSECEHHLYCHIIILKNTLLFFVQPSLSVNGSAAHNSTITHAHMHAYEILISSNLIWIKHFSYIHSVLWCTVAVFYLISSD